MWSEKHWWRFHNGMYHKTSIHGTPNAGIFEVQETIVLICLRLRRCFTSQKDK